MISKYLEPTLQRLWDNAAKKKGKYPPAVEEAALNSLVTGCIYRYLHDKNDYNSFAISEAKVLRDYINTSSEKKYEVIKYKPVEGAYCDLSYGNKDNLIGDGYFLLYRIIEL